LKKILYGLFLLFCLFPFLDILKQGTDSQPNALIIGIVLLIFQTTKHVNFTKFPVEIYIFFFILIIASLLLAISPLDFQTLRSYLNYLSLFVIPFVTYGLLKRTKGLSYQWFKNAVYAWFLIGSIQMFYDPIFLSSLVNRMSSSLENGRGVVAFSPEPTHYGIIMSLFIIIYLINFKDFKNSRHLLVLLFIQLIFFSKSSTAILALSISIVIFGIISIIRLNFKVISYYILSTFLLYIMISMTENSWEETRISTVITKAIENPDILFALDGSVNERFVHAFFPIYSLFDNQFVPHGYGKFNAYMTTTHISESFIDVIKYNQDYTRIMSGYGAVFFELGIFSMGIVYAFYIAFKHLLSQQSGLFAFIFFNVVLFMAIPFTTAIIPFIIGNVIYLKYSVEVQSV
jgi:hypothetical protein